MPLRYDYYIDRAHGAPGRRRMKRTIPQAVFDSKEARKIQKHAIEAAARELDSAKNNLLDEGNPNHPMYENNLFGYGEKEFMAKQYR